MPKLALLIPVMFALSGAGGVTVEGSSPVTLGKKGKAYPVKCSAPIKFTASGPASLVVDVRGQADVIGKPLEVDFTRNDKTISKNALTLKKSKEAGKGFAGVAQIVLVVPEGVQQYAVACDASSDIAMSFRLSKKTVKSNPAAAEVAVEPPKAAETAKTQKDGAKSGDTSATSNAQKPSTEGSASSAGASTGAYVGLFTTTSF
jgi:hypothetical protein